MLVTLSHQGYIKRMSPDIYRAQGRGGKGITGVDTKEGDFIERLIVADNHDYFMVFTADGWVHWLKVYKIPELARTSQGRFIENLLDFGAEGEKGPDGAPIRPKVMSILPVRVFDERFLFTVSREGHVKKTPLSEYSRPKRGGIIGVGLKEGDTLIGAIITSGQNDILLSTAKGQTIRFHETDVRPMGRPGRGRHRDQVQERGRSGRRRRDRGRQGDAAHGLRERLGQAEPDRRVPRPRPRRPGRRQNVKGLERNGDVVAAKLCTGDEDLIMISDQGMVVRTPARDVREIGRSSMGVRVMGLNEGDKVVETVARPADRGDDRGRGSAARSDGRAGDRGRRRAGMPETNGNGDAPPAPPSDDEGES